MCWEIVDEESTNDPEKRRRLHDYNDIDVIFMGKKETKAIQGINLNIPKAKGLSLQEEAFAGMVNLRWLKICGWNHEMCTLEDRTGSHQRQLGTFGRRSHKVYLPHPVYRVYLPHPVYLNWEAFPLKSLSSTFYVQNLVKLCLPGSMVEELWTGVQDLVNLRWIDLRNCKFLNHIPDLSRAKNVKEIDLSYCSKLAELHCSLQHLANLEVLNLSWCENLMKLPPKFDSQVLRVLNLVNCDKVQGCPEVFGKLDRFSLYGPGATELPPCDGFKSLRELYLIDCLNVTKFLYFCTNLERLLLYRTGIKEVPSSVKFLTKLDYLSIQDNQAVSSISGNICMLESLRTLYLRGSNELKCIPEIESASSGLQELHLSGHPGRRSSAHKLEFCKLESLHKLELEGIMDLQSIQLPQSLEVVKAHTCLALETLLMSKKSKLRSLGFANSNRLGDEARRQMMEHAFTRICQLGLPVEVFLPENKFPEWFHYQSQGASVMVPLPQPSTNSTPLIGIAFCAATDTELGKLNNLCIKCTCRVNEDSRLTSKTIIVTRMGNVYPPYQRGSKSYVALRFFDDERMLESIRKVFSSKYCEAAFEFESQSSATRKNPEINKCGVYLKFDEKSLCSQ